MTSDEKQTRAKGEKAGGADGLARPPVTHSPASVIDGSEHPDEEAQSRRAALGQSIGPRTLPHFGYRQKRAPG